MFCLLNRFSCVSLRQCYPSLLKTNIRSLSFRRKSKYKMLADPNVHKIVYSFDYIRIPAGLLSSKLSFPLGSAVVGSCVSLYLNTWDLVVPIIVGNVVHLTLMTVATKFMYNTVGAVFVNKDGEIKEVIFSVIDSWGRRVDRKHNINDIVVVDGNRMIMTAGFFIVAIQNSDIRYKVNFKNGKIYDSEACKYLFNEYEFLKMR